MDIPKGNIEAELIFKQVDQQDIYLTFLPPTREIYENAPLYFIIPGGGWHMETRQSMLDFSKISVEKLRAEGFAVVSTDYRVVTAENDVCMDDMISDCFDAIRYLVHYADVFKIDAQKIVTSGHSAGAHLALMVAYAPQILFVRNSVFSDEFKVVATAGLSAPTILYDCGTTTLGFGIDDLFKNGNTAKNRKKASPITYANERTPATILVAGTYDNLVYHCSSEILYRRLCERGVNAQLVLSEGAGHSFEMVNNDIEPSLTAEDIQNIITEFILKNI